MQEYESSSVGMVKGADQRGELEQRIDTFGSNVLDLEPLIWRIQNLGDRLRGATPTEVALRNGNQTEATSLIPRMENNISKLQTNIAGLRDAISRLEQFI